MMIKLLAMKNAYLTREDGATAIEYGLIAAGIALAIAGAVTAFGTELTTLFNKMAAELSGKGGTGGTAP